MSNTQDIHSSGARGNRNKPTTSGEKALYLICRCASFGSMISNEQANLSQADEEFQGNYHFAHLMQVFDVKRLGEGDQLLGLNLLAAMAVTLGNLARPGSGILTDAGKIIPVGSNLLASGPRITQLIIDEITSYLSKAQAKLIRHTERYEKWSRKRDLEIATNGASSPTHKELEEQLGYNQGEIALSRIFDNSSDGLLFSRGNESQWHQVLASDVRIDIETLVKKMRFFASAAPPRYLLPMLAEAHLDELMVHLGATTKEDVEPLGAICPSLMDGLFSVGKSGCSVRAKLLITDKNATIKEWLYRSNDSSQWLNQLIWLSDYDYGPSFSNRRIEAVGSQLGDLSERFIKAVDKIICQRLEFQSPTPTLLKVSGVDKCQNEWMDFLLDKQSDLPGVGGAGRSLLASLIFGLRLLATSKQSPEGFKYTIKGVVYMARYLINRMVNTKRFWVASCEESKNKILRDKALFLLANAPLDSRTLYRCLRISAADCESLLMEMQAAGIIKFSESKWMIQHRSLRNLTTEIPTTIEV